MPVHRGVKAYIEVDRERLVEYGCRQDPKDEKAFECFVASEVGKVSVTIVGLAFCKKIEFTFRNSKYTPNS